MPPRNYYLVAITLLSSATFPTIPAFARSIATTCELRRTDACAAAPSSAPYSPECQEHRQIVPEYDVLAVEWRRYQGRSFAGATIPSTSAPRKSERRFPR